MSKCYIVGAGDFTRDFTPEVDDLVIAADGGYDELRSRGIRVDLLVGDLDSIKNEPKDTKIIRHKVEKDETDMHLCFLEGRTRGYSDFVILGGTGGRDDHTFANYSLLHFIRKSGGRAELFSKFSKSYVLIDEEMALPNNGEKNGKTVSIFAYGGTCEGVFISGLKYEAKNLTLTPDFPLGVSNSYKECDAKIAVTHGTLLVFEEI